MEAKEEPSSTFNIDLLTGDVTVPSSKTTSFLVQSPPNSSSESNKMLPPPTPNVPSSSKGYVGKAKPPGKVRVKEDMEKDSDEYLRRRQRNNVAVKKSREKTREKSVYTLQKVAELKAENDQLESKISILTKELGVLKDLFMDHARGFCAGGNVDLLTPDQLESLLGCKVIVSGPNSSSVPGTSSTSSTKPAPAPSLMEPLINAAEIELMSFKDNNYSTVHTAQTNNDSSNNLHYTTTEENTSFNDERI